MGIKAGIVGLPNVGKSSLFNAITKSNVEVANYPFVTIKPNQGLVQIKDKRLEIIADMFKSKKVITADFIFNDIAGLVKGASKGEGLGNQFLANIREVDLICHVIRGFENKEVLHVLDKVDPLVDIEIINLELIYADLEILNNRLDKIEKRANATKDKILLMEVSILKKAILLLNSEKLLFYNLPKSELEKIAYLNLLTAKPFIFVLNLSENYLKNYQINNHYQVVVTYAKENNIKVIALSAKLELELNDLEDEDKVLILESFNLKTNGLQELALACYQQLNLKTFFTAGEKETRAWTFKDGMKADQCAGIIHNDFYKKFIKAEIYSYNDLIEFKTEVNIKAKGKLRMEGRNYLMQDGDICYFRINR